jgi:BirA family transcriptional regulator, biotin operon repressor / biotin---[acetyl-CoA-carboxylase] ligase
VTEQAASWRLEVYDSLTSTSDLCRERALAAEAGGLAVLALSQTAGRGSRGRVWSSPPGNLFLSLLLRPATKPREAGMWALLAGVATAEALLGFDVVLKWPNDILYRGAKLGGILVESSLDAAGGLDFLVIGIGLNLAHAPDLPDRRAASLGGVLQPRAVAEDILGRIGHWQGRGWEEVRAAWLAHALPLGAAMTLRQGDTQRSGRFAGLGDDGCLLLDDGGSVRVVSSGEIWLASENVENAP